MPPNNGMVSHHQQQAPIHERHQNLTALLSNSPQRDNGVNSNMPGSMVNSMHSNYSGPGPGNQYMMNNGPPMSNSYVSSSYNPVSSGYMSTSYSTGTNQMYSQTVPSSGGTMSSHSMNMNMQQQGMMHNQHMHPHQNQGPMMNGPNSVMPSNMNRTMSNNQMNSRPPQPMVSETKL